MKPYTSSDPFYSLNLYVLLLILFSVTYHGLHLGTGPRYRRTFFGSVDGRREVATRRVPPHCLLLHQVVVFPFRTSKAGWGTGVLHPRFLQRCSTRLSCCCCWWMSRSVGLSKRLSKAMEGRWV